MHSHSPTPTQVEKRPHCFLSLLVVARFNGEKKGLYRMKNGREWEEAAAAALFGQLETGGGRLRSSVVARGKEGTYGE